MRHIMMIGVISLAAAGIAYSQTDLTGTLGVDLENYRFSNSLKDTTRNYTVDRKLSNHFLRLNITGPIVNEVFAKYSASAKVYGTYYQVSTDNGSASQYITPDLGTYSATLSLLPQKAYPLQFYLNRSAENSVRYEASNKSISEVINPELAVVRRYFSKTSTKGAIWKLGFSENFNSDVEIRQNDMEVERIYDFGENRDIWVVYTNLTINPISEIDTVQLINSIPDDTLIFFIDFILIDSLAPGETVETEVDSGYHDIEIVPFKYNSYRRRVRVDGNMIWEVLYTPPPTPNDLDQTINTASTSIRIGNNGDFTNDAYIEYSTTDENVQNMDIKLGSLTNNANYKIRDNINLNTLTTYNYNNTVIDTISSQTNNSIMHQTHLGYTKSKSFSTSISHSFNSMSSKTEFSDLNSKTNTFSNRFYMPFKKLNYELDIKNSATLLEDNTGYANNQYSTRISNSIDLDLPGLLLEPQNEFKYSYSNQKKPDQSGTNIEDKFILSGEAPGLSSLGVLKFKGEIGWRNRSSAGTNDTQVRYALDVYLNREIVKGLKLGFMSSQEKETYGGSAPTPGSNRDQKNPAREDQGLSSYKFDVQANPMKDLSISANYMIINQNLSQITKYSLSLIFSIPKIDIPVKSFIIKQTRNLEGLPGQTQLVWETKVSYRFRSVVLVLNHSLIEEDLLNEKYNFQEIQAKISRQFDVF